MTSDPSHPQPAGSGASRTLLVSVGALFVAQFVTAIVPFGIGALAPFLRAEYGLQRSQVGLATATIFIAVAICSMPAGRLTDAVGVAKALIVSCLAVALGAAGLGSFDTAASIAASLLVVGVGYSLISPATNKGVIEATPRRLRGRMMGVKQMGVTAGGALAAATLPLGVRHFGISSTLLVTAAAIAIIGSAAAAVVSRLSPTVTSSSSPSVTRSRPDPIRRRRVIRLGTAVGGMVAAQHVVATYLTLFMVDRRGMTATAAAGMLTLLYLSGTIARLAWGWVSDRLGSRLVTMATIGSISIVSLLLLGAVGADLPPWALLGLVIVSGAATQGGNAVYQVAIAEEDVEHAGWASGVGMALGFTGAIVAPPLFGAVVDSTGSYALGLTLVACVVSAAVVIVISLARSGVPAHPGQRSRTGPPIRTSR